MNIELVDIGANLADECFEKDIDIVVKNAISVGVKTIIVTGSSEKSSQKALDLALKYPVNIYSTVGIHPHSAKYCNKSVLLKFKEMAKNKKVVAIGECGLDYNRDFSPRPVQDRWFEEHIELACELNMPLFLHERDASEKFIEILSKYKDSLPPTVVHCFTGNEDELDEYLKMGFYIGITGWICDERRGLHLKEIVKKIPSDKLMLETDAPYLIPRNMKNRPKSGRNEPAYLPYVANMVSKCVKKEIEIVANETTKSAKTFFKI